MRPNKLFYDHIPEARSSRTMNAYEIRKTDWLTKVKPQEFDVHRWLSQQAVDLNLLLELLTGHPAALPSHIEEWPFAKVCESMLFFALYGAVDENPEPAVARLQIDHGLNTLEALLKVSPMAAADVPGRVLSLARGRMAIDTKVGTVDVTALATFGGVTPGRIQNLMSGEASQFRSEAGGIPVEQALGWLDGRPAWWPSIWNLRAAQEVGPKLKVPVASDGTIFAPVLKRRSGYMIGPKGAEDIVEDYDTALEKLNAMPEPRWRRPNDNGNWGIVKGTSWSFLTRSELEAWRF